MTDFHHGLSLAHVFRSRNSQGSTTAMIITTPGEFQKGYLAALRTHCSQAARDQGMEAAQHLGTQAMAMGLETLDLAAVHHRALAGLESMSGTPGEITATTERAGDFFAATLIPIEANRPAALETNSNLEQLNAELARITRDLKDSTRDLELGIAERKSAEEALKTSGDESAKLLEEVPAVVFRCPEAGPQDHRR